MPYKKNKKDKVVPAGNEQNGRHDQETTWTLAELLNNTQSRASYASSAHSFVSNGDSYSSLCNEPMYQLLEKTSEDDYDTDVELDGKPGETVTEEQVYRRACEEVGVSPISYYIRHHHDAHLNLNYRCMSPKAVKALSIALVTNTAVTTLDLEHDGINAEGVQYLMEMLVENCFIQTLQCKLMQPKHVAGPMELISDDYTLMLLPLAASEMLMLVPTADTENLPRTALMNLSNNELRTWGVEVLCKLLPLNISLKCIKLSGNKLKCNAASYFADTLSSNFRISELDLSYNQFGDKGAEFLGQMLATNESLEILNLQWNQIQTEGAVALSAGLRMNITLKSLNLSYNGFGNEGALAMGETLKFNSTLLELNLSSNHINNEGVNMLCKGLDVNENIKILCLSNNPITVDSAIRLLEVVRKNEKSNLEKININNVLVNENFMELLKSITQDRPQFVIETKGVGGSIAGSRKHRPDPMKVIQDYLDKHKLRLSDFFRNMDKAGNMSVPISDFKKALQQFNIPLDLIQVEELLSKLDRDNTGSIDYRNLVDTRKRMIRDQREQLHKEETRQRKEKQKAQRVLKTLNSAIKAITPRNSFVIVPGQVKLPAIQTLKSFSSQHLSGTSLSSWHHVGRSNSSQYSVPILSNIQVHRPFSHSSNGPSVSGARLGSSVQVNSVSQPELLLKSPGCSLLDPSEMFDQELDPVTKSRPSTSFWMAQSVTSGHKSQLKTKM
ncbi:leucine-rich repeat-containing protein 74A [Chiloscyllium plagiosum]|uniref:leucine-rich repeat-containing protein 74A n=1 Tax=Chiloscyllium plagiosum TaxID=36176 RepID=UPI001CB7E809|nr:leucine-rich repeat-containing protein 74A [Chiloscyllium plagiosum]